MIYNLMLEATGRLQKCRLYEMRVNLKPGDLLDWSIEAVRDDTIVVVRKAGRK
jgi:Mn-containing catalase